MGTEGLPLKVRGKERKAKPVFETKPNQQARKARTLHYGTSSVVNWKLRNWPKWLPRPPFWWIWIVSDKQYLGTIFCKFHFLAYIWFELIIYRRKAYSIVLMYFTGLWRTMAKIYKQNILGTSWTDIPKRPTQIFELMEIDNKYLEISNSVFTMNSSTDKK